LILNLVSWDTKKHGGSRDAEHLLEAHASFDSDENWDACVDFMSHLYWHKPRQAMLG
jgi:hypothetical protein